MPNKFSPSTSSKNLLVLYNILQLHHFRNVRLPCDRGFVKLVIKRRKIKKFSKALVQKLGVNWREQRKYEDGGLAVKVFLYFCKSCPWGLAISQVVLRVPAALKGVFALLYPDKLHLIVQSRGGFLEKEVVLLYRNTPCVVIGETLPVIVLVVWLIIKLLGRHQNPWTETCVPFLRKHGIALARRNSGGGTGRMELDWITMKLTWVFQFTMTWETWTYPSWQVKLVTIEKQILVCFAMLSKMLLVWTLK